MNTPQCGNYNKFEFRYIVLCYPDYANREFLIIWPISIADISASIVLERLAGGEKKTHNDVISTLIERVLAEQRSKAGSVVLMFSSDEKIEMRMGDSLAEEVFEKYDITGRFIK